MFARTDRLLLRPGWREDAPALAAAVNELGIARNCEGAPWPYSIADAEAFLAEAHADPARTTLLAWRRTAAAPELVGAVGLARTGAGQALFATWTTRRFWGRGYASEAGAALLEMARHSLRLDHVFAWSFLDNPAGARLLDRLGFAATGEIVRATSLARGGAATPCRLHVRPLGVSMRADADAALAA
ncbi:MAG: GNAT family N-acetyltransferase [Alphaproteobacteria bacterium]|nr:GNAT family N-acetyltransferase [Alphaproteobacteria bacterium]